jgi:hypothetical protein
MAIGKITGQMLNSNLERAGDDLAFDANLVYLDVNNRRVGINNTNPAYALDVTGNAYLGNLYILGNTISSDTGKIGLGSTENVVITGGTPYDVLYTDGDGNLAFGNLNVISGMDGFTGNNIILGTNVLGDLSNALPLTETTTVTDAIAELNQLLGNITDSTGSTIHVGGDISGGTITSPTIDNINANVLAANLAISTLDANVGLYELDTNANIGTIYNNLNALDANVGAFETYANVEFSTINANIGAFELYANANIGSIYNHVNTLDANVGLYELDTNANIGTIFNHVNTIDANIGAFELYANANIGSIYNHVNTLDANVGAFETYANTTFATQSNVGSIYNHVNTLDANVGAFETYANLQISSTNSNVTNLGNYANANAAVQSIAITSLATGANANTAAYLATYTGNISAGNVISTFYGNVYTDYITGQTGNIVTITGTGALQIPVGTTAEQPVGTNGMIRFNSDVPSLEYFDGTLWIPVTNTVTDQQIIPGSLENGDGPTFTLNQATTSIGIIVSINGTLQNPSTAYSVVGDQITFTETPLATDIIDIRFLGASVTINNTLSDDLTVEGNLTVNGIFSFGNLIPQSNVTYSLGSSTHQWKEIWVSSNTIYLGGTPIGISDGVLTVSGNVVASYGNANVTAYLASGTDSTINAITTAWKANAAIQDANIGLLTNNVTTLYSNAASQSNSINSLNASLTAANAAITAANVYNKAYTDTAVANLVNSAPAQLDTLNELSIALGNNASFSTTITGMIGNVQANITAANAVIATHATIASPAFTGTPTAPTANISVNNTQLATTAYVHNMLPSGIIMLWSGSSASIPYGWYLCDGNNGTPNLRDRFVVGAGNTYAVGGTGGSADATLVSHSHTASSTTSTSISDPGHRHWISSAAYDDGNGSGTGNNNQEYGLWADAGSYSPNDPNKGTGRYNLSATTGISASSTTSTTVNATGNSATNANLPPYYALCYIMKS